MSPLALSPLGSELLDDPYADPDAVRLSLHNIMRANRWFGGLAAVRFGLDRLAPYPSPRISLLDVGTGSGDVPAMARRWARRKGMVLDPIGLERSLPAARMAARSGLAMVQGCGGEIPLATRSVDVVIVSQVAHHLDRASCIALIRECQRVARHGVVLADLRRSALAARAWGTVGRILRFDHYTIADGVTSLHRGFTVAGMQALLLEAGVSANVSALRAVRLVAAWRVGS